VTLPRGVVDLAADLPSRDVHLLAPAAILVAHDDIHSALVPLTLQIAEQVHERGDLVNPPDTFPSKRFAEQPLHPEARRYLNYGPSFLQRYLPFWGANLIDRMKVMLLPLVTLMIPLAKFLPPVYRWRIRSRIYRWYRVLRAMDQRLREAQLTDVSAERKMLAEMERELGEEWVPLSYMEEFYNLRMHIDLVKRRVDEYHARDADRSEP